ncbi:V-set domain-containing T-cell activation inhibitor 1-like [Triplophysa dalaica]|uniref:V-set domain-containing T-cell activation inhibitor 1-like n=1 Tax=Triplophysa dalaica TaxID=1582913 RepID=UPI0024DFA2A7|nr:V-set domain-containing T-cell activation inhibitor 1-like [Triplophysa dalaica]
MIIGCWFIGVFVLLKNVCTADTVYSDDKVEGVIGHNASLPCASNINDHNLQDINVLWRHNGSTNVLAIINGEASLDYQKPKYKYRTQTFPDNYKDGNFTLKLNNLTHTDAGMYQCYITHSSELVTLQLLLNESPEEKSSDVEGGKRNILILVFCFSLLIVSIVCIVIACVMKSGNTTSSQGFFATGACLPCQFWFNPISKTPEKKNNQNN